MLLNEYMSFNIIIAHCNGFQTVRDIASIKLDTVHV